ncbi:unnamed protein product [Rotaria sp. Silwood2]|nr:unnamed protein product [Rotaria sp. Silwood2]CAF2478713.1 unnamed protein product [Rotaria sp. Silwood2]CAF2712523.1 unnamed protein product [Rotaria sp. Silwood2]CAF2862948.1 unnamed protein product [Rotaria sp. Silwood2]CAF3881486.1 unnamed protein product [Rotaria sp. Silwood2]
MQKGFFGAVQIAHTNCIDNTGKLINAAKERLTEIHDEYEERKQHWNQIALLLNRDDLNNLRLSTSVIYRNKDSSCIHN